jgi:hypothetical protein
LIPDPDITVEMISGINEDKSQKYRSFIAGLLELLILRVYLGWSLRKLSCHAVRSSSHFERF